MKPWSLEKAKRQLTALLAADPFTELAELTNGMAFLGDDLDDEIVKTATGKTPAKKIIVSIRPCSSSTSEVTRTGS